MTTLQKRLAELGACDEAIKWVGKRTLTQIIADCDRADWLMWLYMRMAGTPGWSSPRDVVSLLLVYVPECELPVTRRWVAGEDVSLNDATEEYVSAGLGDLIPPHTIRELLKRGRTLGRKAAA